VKNWEIWKSANVRYNEESKPTQKDYATCTKLHRRYETRKEANRVSKEMKRQGILCCVRKRA
jgi:hypothetical protein